MLRAFHRVNKTNLGSVLLASDTHLPSQAGRHGRREKLTPPPPPRISSLLPHLPHSHVPGLGQKQPPDEQGAAPVPGVLQAAVHPHPALDALFQPVLSKQGLELLGAWVVPGPHRLLLERKAGRGQLQGTEQSCPRPLMDAQAATTSPR